jgi:hypothetical protein
VEVVTGGALGFAPTPWELDLISPTHSPAPPLPVSIIVPTFNRARLLGEALDSLVAQSRPAAEILVVDDGSDDDTATVVERFGPAVTYLRQDNSGKAVALNLGLSRASQDAVWIFDDDDIATPDALERLYEPLAADPDLDFTYGLCDKFEGDWPSPLTEPNTSYVSGDRTALYVRLMEDFFIWQGSMLVRRRCYAAVGPFDVRLTRSQDYEMNLRLARRFRGRGLSFVAFHQRHHAGVRGPRAASVGADKVEAAWRKFNQIIFRDLHASHDLMEFYVETDPAIDPRRKRLTALLQRACIMARKGLWDLAEADMVEAAELSTRLRVTTLNEQEIAALRRVFQSGARSTFSNSDEASAFFATIRMFASRRQASQIAGNLLLPVSHRLRKLLTEKASRAEVGQVLLLLSHLLRPRYLAEYWKARERRLFMYRVTPLECEAPA